LTELKLNITGFAVDATSSTQQKPQLYVCILYAHSTVIFPKILRKCWNFFHIIS